MPEPATAPAAPRVGIVMGSDSDWAVMQAAATALDEFGVGYEADVVSAHRMPDAMINYGRQAHRPGTGRDHRRRRRRRAPAGHAGSGDAVAGDRRSGRRSPTSTAWTRCCRSSRCPPACQLRLSPSATRATPACSPYGSWPPPIQSCSSGCWSSKISSDRLPRRRVPPYETPRTVPRSSVIRTSSRCDRLGRLATPGPRQRKGSGGTDDHTYYSGTGDHWQVSRGATSARDRSWCRLRHRRRGLRCGRGSCRRYCRRRLPGRWFRTGDHTGGCQRGHQDFLIGRPVPACGQVEHVAPPVCVRRFDPDAVVGGEVHIVDPQDHHLVGQPGQPDAGPNVVGEGSRLAFRPDVRAEGADAGGQSLVGLVGVVQHRDATHVPVGHEHARRSLGMGWCC